MDELTVDDLTVDDLTVDDLTVDEMTVDDLTCDLLENISNEFPLEVRIIHGSGHFTSHLYH